MTRGDDHDGRSTASAPPRPNPDGDESLLSLLTELAAAPDRPIDESVGIGALVGRYRLDARIGGGAFGVVFAAHDTELGREVALKLLRAARQGDPQQVARFKAEAALVAGLSHPHIVTLHDYGSIEESPFLVFERLRGETLDQRLQRGPLSSDELTSVALAIARAIDYAHRAGVVHGDVKPSNLFLDERGGLKVLDFGLARAWRGGHSSDDALGGAGTPAYMSPEQWRGEPATKRSDVFAIGVVLYQLATGKLPFADGYGVARSARAPAALEGAALPARMAQVLARALAQTSGQRHADGSELLAALERATRSPARRVLAAGALVAAALALLAIGWLGVKLIRQRQRATLEVRVAQQLGLETHDIEASLRYSYLQPAHDVRDEERRIRGRLSALQASLERLGDVGEGGGEYALGRGYLALHDPERARQFLEAAWARGYRTSEVSEALGQAIGAIYQIKREAVRGSDPFLRARRYAELEKTYRDPALQRLVGNSRASTYVKALIALYSGRHDEALRLADAVMAETAWFYEAQQLRGDVFLEQCRASLESHALDTALARCAAAGSEYERALERARSDPDLHARDCARLTLVTAVERKRGGAAEAAYQSAVARCDRALAIDPDREATLLVATAARQEDIELELSRGRDPRPVIAEAVALVARARAAHPDDPEPLRRQGKLLVLKARYENDSGLDAGPSFAAAVTAYEAARRNGSDEAAEDLGELYRTRADFERARGRDPSASLELAIASLNASRSQLALVDIATAYWLWAQADYERGADPRPRLQRAVDAIARARAVGLDAPALYGTEGGLYYTEALYKMRESLDAEAAYERSEAAYEHQSQLTPTESRPFLNLASVLDQHGAYLRQQRRDPSALLERAQAALANGLELNPRNANGHAVLGNLLARLAGDTIKRGKDPSSLLERARAELDLSGKLRPDPGMLLPMLADVEYQRASWARHERRAPWALCERGAALFRQLLQKTPDNPDVALEFATWSGTCIRWKLEDRLDATAELTEALGYARAALRLDPKMVAARAAEGALTVLQARATHDPLRRDELCRSGRALLDAAIAVDASLRNDFADELAESRQCAGGAGARSLTR